jgi:WD40 repeat protein
MDRYVVRSVAATLACVVLTPAVLGQSRVDALGDPLPDRAIARLGTTRMRHHSGSGLGCIAWSPDGKMIATTSFNKHLAGDQGRLWEASTGKPMCPLENNERHGPSFVCFSPNSKMLAAAAGNKIVLWDVITGKELGQFVGHKDEVDALALQNGGKTMLSVSRDGAVYLVGC